MNSSRIFCFRDAVVWWATMVLICQADLYKDVSGLLVQWQTRLQFCCFGLVWFFLPRISLLFSSRINVSQHYWWSQDILMQSKWRVVLQEAALNIVVHFCSLKIIGVLASWCWFCNTFRDWYQRYLWVGYSLNISREFLWVCCVSF